ncbi:MAG: CHASE3 domain-containing protein [Chloroherpetonaceae bacterium]|nr:CHASE3 domain-containing protein [Chloroherpetonaceae bacterium]
MKWLQKFERAAVILFACSLVALVLVQVLSFQNSQQIEDFFQQQVRSRNLILSLEQCLSLVKDAETGQRGYLLTGNEAYLEPYYESLRLLDEKISYIRSQLQDDAEARPKLDELQIYLSEKLQELRETIQLRRDSSFEAAVRLVLSDKGKLTMDNLRSAFAKLIAKEQDEMQRYTAETQRYNQVSKALTLLSGAVAITTLCVAFGLFYVKNRQLNDAQAQLQHQNTLLEQQNAALQRSKLLEAEIFSFAAHDVKNIIQVILLSAQALKAKLLSNEIVLRHSSTIEREAQRVVDLINELLLSVRTEEQTSLSLEKTEVDVGNLVKTVCNTLSIKAEKKKQSICVEVEGINKTMADKSSLKVIVENLVSNAIKYSPEGKSIWVSVWHDVKNVYLKVRDEGLGFAPEEKDKLFKRFQKLSARPTGGEISTGLGLSIAKKLVELHNGRIWAESQGKGLGSTFVVELPLLQANDTRATKAVVLISDEKPQESEAESGSTSAN